MTQPHRHSLALALTAAACLLMSSGRDAWAAPQEPAPQEPAPQDPAPQEPAPPEAPAKEEPAPAAPAGEAEKKPAADEEIDAAVKRAIEAQAEAQAAGPSDEQDAAARELLEKAAALQGGAKLVEPEGKLESFQVTLHRVIFEQEKPNDEGGTTTMKVEADENGLVLYWKADQIRTLWSIDGKRTQRGRFLRRGTIVPWLHDGSKTQLLSGEERYATDREQIERDQRIVRALLDVGILRTMLADGSRWQIIEDKAYPGVALRRTPPAAKDVQLQLTLWLDKPTGRVDYARLSPNARDESTMFYAFGYDKDFPRVKGDKLVFPFQFAVFEQLPYAVLEERNLLKSPPAPRQIMEGTVAEVAFNTLTDADLAPPLAGK